MHRTYSKIAVENIGAPTKEVARGRSGLHYEALHNIYASTKVV
jgi:hypothetical protein